MSYVTPTGVLDKHKSVKISSVTPTRVPNECKSVISISSVTPTGVLNAHKSVIRISSA